MAKILVGVQDSIRSLDAVAFARRLAENTGAELVVATVYSRRALHAGAALPGLPEPFLAAVRAEAAAVEARVRHEVDSSPTRALRRIADQEDAALVVIGSSARARLGRVLAGATAERLLHGATRPVVVVPRDYRLRGCPIRRIVVGYDGSESAAEVIRSAVALGHHSAAAVSVVHAVDRRASRRSATRGVSVAGYAIPPGDPVREGWARLAVDLADTPAGNRIAAEVVRADPAKELVRRSRSADLLVLGASGHGAHRSVLDGSIAGCLIRQASCPLLFVPGSALGMPERGTARAFAIA
jgi:nucleotide-binding universal stress UspA family protein